MCEKDYVWNPATYNCENGKYIASILDDSAIKCDETIDLYNEDVEAKSYKETNFSEEKATCNTIFFIFYLHFYRLLLDYW